MPHRRNQRYHRHHRHYPRHVDNLYFLPAYEFDPPSNLTIVSSPAQYGYLFNDRYYRNFHTFKQLRSAYSKGPIEYVTYGYVDIL